jgi:hypothetical protein
MADRGANIDIFFRNGLKDYEVLPPNDVWEGIRPVIRKRQKSLVILRAAAAFAAIVTVGAAAYILSERLPLLFNGPAITLNQEARPEGLPAANSIRSNNNPAEIINYAEVPESDAAASEESNIGFYYRIREISLFTPVVRDNELSLQRSFPGPEGKSASVGITTIGNPAADAGEAALADAGKPEPQNRKWSVGATVTPSYYSRISFGSDDAASSLVSAEKAAVSYSGGFTFAYNVSRRISVQTGVFYSSVGQKISGISSYSGFSQYLSTKSGSPFSVITSSGTISSSNNDLFLMDNNSAARVVTIYTRDVFDPVKAELSYISNAVYQNFSYLEIPFVMRYKLLDRSIDFNLVGGLSYNLLLTNSAYTTGSGEKFVIGETEGLSPVTFSSTIGMGMEYKLSTSLSLNLEPTFRYYLTPLGGLAGSSIHPYSFGILSGIFYKF